MSIPIYKRDLILCLLCYDPMCSKTCNYNQEPGKVLRSLRFSNYKGAVEKLTNACINCNADCENSCVLPKQVKIKAILSRCYDEKIKHYLNFKRNILKSDICGIPIENPFLLSSSVVASNYDMLKRAFIAGWAGASFKTISMFDMHEASPRYSAIKGISGTIQSFKNIEQLSDHSVIDNIEMISKLKEEFPNKFLLISIMGRDEKEWKYLAMRAEKAGASALELNFSCPNMTEDETGSDVGQIPRLVELYTKAVTSVVKIPVIAKLTPNVMSMTQAALAAKRGGAKGISAINTIKSITEFDVINGIYDNSHEIAIGGLSGQSVKPIALRFISELTQNEEFSDMHISGMGGIYTYEDAIMFLSLGAKSLQITTAVMEYGYRIIDDLIDGLELFLGENNISMSELQGYNKNKIVDIKNIDRDYIIYPKINHSTCVGCGRCYISCSDGGHQAMKLVNRVPTLDPSKCVGCHLCVIVCPTNSITSSNIKIPKNHK